MVLSKDLKSQLKKLFEERKFSEIELFINNSIKDEDKSSGILNLLGASKVNKNKKDKDADKKDNSSKKKNKKSKQKKEDGKE
jgi:ATP phosphoribosyltransferase regulatory subunit HisZ